MAAVARFYAGPNQFTVDVGTARAGARLKSRPRRDHSTDNSVTGSLRAALDATQVPFAHNRNR
jgi:ABC-type Fe2+-enterobactin transport system substrate-binding protein